MLKFVVDLDGTLAKYKRGDARGNGIYHIGDPLPGSQEFVKKLSEQVGNDGQKAQIIIFTRRLNEEDLNEEERTKVYNSIQKWLVKHNFIFHEIYFRIGKPDGTAFIDDRGVQCRPQENPNAYDEAVRYINNVILG